MKTDLNTVINASALIGKKQTSQEIDDTGNGGMFSKIACSDRTILTKDSETVQSDKVVSLKEYLKAVREPSEVKSYPVDRERLASFFLKIVAIPGGSGKERQIADFLKEEITKLGFTAVEDKAGEEIGGNTGNLLFTIPANVKGAKPITLISHMDTVKLAVGAEPVRDGDVVHPKGPTALGGDNRAGISDIMEAIKVIQEQNIPHGDIQVIFSVGEEAGLLGSMALDTSQILGKIGFAVDSFKAHEIYITRKGKPLGGPKKDPCIEAEKEFKRPVSDKETEELTKDELEILELTKAAIKDIGLEPEFRKIYGAASDALSLREKGIPAITIGAGEENIHRTAEVVRISELEHCTQLILALITRVAGMAPALVRQQT